MTNNKVSTADIVVAGSILISLTLLLTDYSSLAPLVLLAGIMYYLMLCVVLLAGIMYYLMLCAPAGSDRCE
jgi:hypothetical protein